MQSVCVCSGGPALSLGPAPGFGDTPLLAQPLLLPQETQSPWRRAASGPDAHGGGAQGGAATRLRLRPASIHRPVGGALHIHPVIAGGGRSLKMILRGCLFWSGWAWPYADTCVEWSVWCWATWRSEIHLRRRVDWRSWRCCRKPSELPGHGQNTQLMIRY